MGTNKLPSFLYRGDSNRSVISQSIPCLHIPFDHDLFRDMVPPAESDGKEFSRLQPTQNPLLADSRQADHLCDTEIVRQDLPFFFQTQHIIICFSLPQFPLREIFTFSTAPARVCVELSGRKFALPLRVGTGEVNAHILHPDEIGVHFCTAVLTWNDALIQHPLCFALGDMEQFIKLLLGDDLVIHFPFPPFCSFRVTMPWFLQVQLWRSHPGAHRCPL